MLFSRQHSADGYHSDEGRCLSLLSVLFAVVMAVVVVVTIVVRTAVVILFTVALFFVSPPPPLQVEELEKCLELCFANNVYIHYNSSIKFVFEMKCKLTNVL